MAIRFKLRGVEFETDSAEEARNVVTQFEEDGDSPDLTDSEDSDDSDGSGTENNVNAKLVALGANAKAMLKILMQTQIGQGRATKEIAEEIGVNGAKGLAAVTRQIRAWGRQEWGLGKNDCVYRFISTGKESCVMVGRQLRNKIKGHEAKYLA